jgi:hypothetical protein
MSHGSRHGPVVRSPGVGHIGLRPSCSHSHTQRDRVLRFVEKSLKGTHCANRFCPACMMSNTRWTLTAASLVTRRLDRWTLLEWCATSRRLRRSAEVIVERRPGLFSVPKQLPAGAAAVEHRCLLQHPLRRHVDEVVCTPSTLYPLLVNVLPAGQPELRWRIRLGKDPSNGYLIVLAGLLDRVPAVAALVWLVQPDDGFFVSAVQRHWRQLDSLELQGPEYRDLANMLPGVCPDFDEDSLTFVRLGSPCLADVFLPHALRIDVESRVILEPQSVCCTPTTCPQLEYASIRVERAPGDSPSLRKVAAGGSWLRLRRDWAVETLSKTVASAADGRPVDLRSLDIRFPLDYIDEDEHSAVADDLQAFLSTPGLHQLEHLSASEAWLPLLLECRPPALQGVRSLGTNDADESTLQAITSRLPRLEVLDITIRGGCGRSCPPLATLAHLHTLVLDLAAEANAFESLLNDQWALGDLRWLFASGSPVRHLTLRSIQWPRDLPAWLTAACPLQSFTLESQRSSWMFAHLPAQLGCFALPRRLRTATVRVEGAAMVLSSGVEAILKGVVQRSSSLRLLRMDKAHRTASAEAHSDAWMCRNARGSMARYQINSAWVK